MNTIILLFIMISVMFISGSVNSIISVTSALDNYFDKAGVTDIMAVTLDKAETHTVEQELADSKELYSDIKTQKAVILDDERHITFADSGKKTGNTNSFFAYSTDNMVLNYFDESGNVIKDVKQGEMYVVQKLLDQSDIKTGDVLRIKIGDTEKELTVVGGFKDAAMGSALMGNSAILLSSEDHRPIYEAGKKAGLTGKLSFITTDHADEIKSRLDESDISFLGLAKRDFIKSSYIMDMVIAFLLLVVSAILIVVALIVLRFTISFTISSEFREIGVMKAIGIGNMKIRRQYLVKYLAISVVGAVIGIILSFPFADLLVSVSSRSVMIETDGDILTNIICAVVIVAVIMLFCLLCTRKASKLSPIDAIRNGQTGERFRKKGILHLSKSKLGATTFMAGNDVLSAPKRFLIIIVVFALSILPIQFLDIVASTLNTKDMLVNLGLLASDVSFEIHEDGFIFSPDGNGRQNTIQTFKKIEKKLDENGIPGRAYIELMFSTKLEFGGKTSKVLALQGVNNKASEHKYTKGSAPQSKDEIAIQPATAKDIGADIGDTITVTIGDKKYELMISGFYEAMNNMGQGIRIHEDLETNYDFCAGYFFPQLEFDDDPSEKVVKERIEKLKDIFPEYSGFKTGAQAAQETTQVGPVFDTLKLLFLVLSSVIVILVAVLMERSMVIKETSEIATLKAIGFKDSKIIKWHTKRFIITAVISAMLAAALALPLTKLASGPIFSYMGVSQGVKYTFSPLRVCVAYPVIIMVLMAVSVWITAAYTRRITPQQTSSIE